MLPDAALILPDRVEQALTGDVSIGRDAENEIVIDDESVSRRHAVVAHRKGRWWIADTGSVNGTALNGAPLPAGAALQLRHADRVQLGRVTLVFSSPAERDDPHRTEALETPDVEPALPRFQQAVVAVLAEPWLGGASLDALPSNRDLAERLETSEEAVKGALRRLYARAGLTGGTAHAKRRELCRIARARGWV